MINKAQCENCGAALIEEDGKLICPHCRTNYVKTDEINNTYVTNNQNEIKNFYGNVTIQSEDTKAKIDGYFDIVYDAIEKKEKTRAMEFLNKIIDIEPSNKDADILYNYMKNYGYRYIIDLINDYFKEKQYKYTSQRFNDYIKNNLKDNYDRFLKNNVAYDLDQFKKNQTNQTSDYYDTTLYHIREYLKTKQKEIQNYIEMIESGDRQYINDIYDELDAYLKRINDYLQDEIFNNLDEKKAKFEKQYLKKRKIKRKIKIIIPLLLGILVVAVIVLIVKLK